jgi:DNA-directed RNA polymerase specialized sigma subunit
MESFEIWLLRRVGQAVEAGEVPVKVLMDLQAALEAARAISQEAGHAAAIGEIADIAGIPEEQAAETLAAIEAQPTVTREILMRRIAEAWLEGQRRATGSSGVEGRCP